MQKSKNLLATGTFLFLSTFMSACTTHQTEAPAKTSDKAGSATMAATGTGHTHPANKCTNTITHKHPNGVRQHKHSYSCKGNAKSSEDAHLHPANKCTKSTTHTHPAGKRGHSHKYTCSAKRSSANAHIHSANKMTRSMRHVHPNGNKKHNHHYSQ